MSERGPRPESNKVAFLHIDRKSPEISEALAKAPLYKKEALVHAHKASVGEEVVTVTATGDVETINIAKDKDWVITNASGEDYILPESIFSERCESTNVPGVYRSTGYCRAIENPYGKPITISASWGAPQNGDEHCLIADTCDADGNLRGEPYLIDRTAFTQTYSDTSTGAA
jgi:hypothetical protein